MFPLVISPLNKVSELEENFDNYNDEEVDTVEFMHQDSKFDSMNLDNHIKSLS